MRNNESDDSCESLKDTKNGVRDIDGWMEK